MRDVIVSEKRHRMLVKRNFRHTTLTNRKKTHSLANHFLSYRFSTSRCENQWFSGDRCVSLSTHCIANEQIQPIADSSQKLAEKSMKRIPLKVREHLAPLLNDLHFFVFSLLQTRIRIRQRVHFEFFSHLSRACLR